MNFRQAEPADLPQLQEVFKKIIEKMKQDNIGIWDEIYPCESFSDDIFNRRLLC